MWHCVRCQKRISHSDNDTYSRKERDHDQAQPPVGGCACFVTGVWLKALEAEKAWTFRVRLNELQCNQNEFLVFLCTDSWQVKVQPHGTHTEYRPCYVWMSPTMESNMGDFMQQYRRHFPLFSLGPNPHTRSFLTYHVSSVPFQSSILTMYLGKHQRKRLC